MSIGPASYLLSRSDGALAAEYAFLRKADDSAERGGLIAAIKQRVADPPLEGGVYLLADPSFTPVAGNLMIAPAEKPDSAERGDTRVPGRPQGFGRASY
jgi:hypothetical protein